MSVLEGEKYISLATFRKTGKAVETPVWFARDPDDGRRLFVFTARDSGKVKRLRNSGRSRVAACDMRGKVHGEWLDAETRIVDDSDPAIGRALQVLRKKYGITMWLTDIGARLSGRYHRRAYLVIQLTS